jgi:hypothetical protein
LNSLFIAQSPTYTTNTDHMRISEGACWSVPQEIHHQEVKFKLWKREVCVSEKEWRYLQEPGEHRTVEDVIRGIRHVHEIQEKAKELDADIIGRGLPRLLHWALEAFREFDLGAEIHVDRDWRQLVYIFWQGEYRGSV